MNNKENTNIPTNCCFTFENDNGRHIGCYTPSHEELARFQFEADSLGLPMDAYLTGRFDEVIPPFQFVQGLGQFQRIMNLLLDIHQDDLINMLKTKVPEVPHQELKAEVEELALCLNSVCDSILNLPPQFFNEENLHMSPVEFLNKTQEIAEEKLALIDARLAELSDPE